MLHILDDNHLIENLKPLQIDIFSVIYLLSLLNTINIENIGHFGQQKKNQ